MTTRSLKALFIHGVGEQESDFAHDSRRILRAALKERGVSLYARSVWWAPLADKAQKAFLARTVADGSEGNMTQRLTIGTLGDALFYCRSPRLRAECQSTLTYEHRMLGGGECVIFAHSLGCLLALDWLHTQPKVAVRQFVTMGCNLQLFHQDEGIPCPPQIGCAGKWTNFWEKDDMLGWKLSSEPSLAHVKDVKVKLGGWLSWTGLAHTAFFGDKKLWGKTVPEHLKLG